MTAVGIFACYVITASVREAPLFAFFLKNDRKVAPDRFR
jgi:hypothetical protein